MNPKTIGERGENCVIGELSKLGLQVAIPLSDNIPFDLIVIADGRLFRAQVKSSSCHQNGTVVFDFSSNNWYTGEKKKYSSDDCDIVLFYDLRENVAYLMGIDEVNGRASMTIRLTKDANGRKGNWYEDYVMNRKRVKDCLGFDVPDFSMDFSRCEPRAFDHVCSDCGETFCSKARKVLRCPQCGKAHTKAQAIARRKVERPSKEELAALIAKHTWVAIGEMFGVSDNAVRKWARQYGLIE